MTGALYNIMQSGTLGMQSLCCHMKTQNLLYCLNESLSAVMQVTFFLAQSVSPDLGTPPSPSVSVLSPTAAAQSLATQAATNSTAVFESSPTLVLWAASTACWWIADCAVCLRLLRVCMTSV